MSRSWTSEFSGCRRMRGPTTLRFAAPTDVLPLRSLLRAVPEPVQTGSFSDQEPKNGLIIKFSTLWKRCPYLVLFKKLIFSEESRGFSHTLGSPLPCTTLAPVRRRLGG